MHTVRALVTAFVVLIVFVPAVTVFADGGTGLPKRDSTVTMNGNVKITQKNFYFENGDFFWIRRLEPEKTTEALHFTSFEIPGNNIEIRYIKSNGGVKEWFVTENEADTEAATLFISTDKYHVILGTPSVYARQDDYGTLAVIKSLEMPVKITKGEGRYKIEMSFPQDTAYISEIWGLQSKNRLIEWNAFTEEQFMAQELADGRRISLDGYYFQTYNDYTPGGPDVLFRHPSSYPGGAFSRSAVTNAEYALGYVIMKLSAANQNEQGYFTVPCASGWLSADFGIEADYYDTRWNTDFAVNLLDAYKTYGDPEFFERARIYANFFLSFAEKNSFVTGKGILVQDYWHPRGEKLTHASLNHHLAELNFLLRYYEVTGDEAILYTATLMLTGVEETEREWLLPDGNLNYALFYEGEVEELVDYPFLTYNDLFLTRDLLLRVLGKKSGTIQRLMDSKLAWMIDNGVSGYREMP